MLISVIQLQSARITRACSRFGTVLLIAGTLLAATVTAAQAATATATWNPNPEPDIAGYKLSYGTASGSYTTTVDVGNVTSFVVQVVAGQTYYFVVSAYNTSGMLSAHSTEVPFTVPAGSTPTISSLSPTAGAVGTTVSISGSNFGATKGTSTVTFNGTTAAPTSWSASSIVAPVPAGTTTGNVVVTVGGVASNAQTFTITAAAPTLTSLSPTSGAVGGSVTLTGTNFGATKGTSTVTFHGTTATPSSWSASSIVVPVPTGATTGNVVVTVAGVASNAMTFTVTTAAPTVTSLSPASGIAGASVTIVGTNFGATRGTSTVTFNGTTATPSSWSATSIVVPVPASATSGNVVVTVGGVASNGQPFTVSSGTATSIALVQHAGRDAGTTTSSTLAFPSSNTAGNWLAVLIRAGQMGQTFTVTDTRGNTYRRAQQFTQTRDGVTLGIFYAENIAGGANTVTVKDTVAGGTLRFAILEYTGVASANSLDGSAAAEGTGTSAGSGSISTTTSGDLAIGLTSTANGVAVTAGTGFVTEEKVPSSKAKLTVEDQRLAVAGPIAATATLSSSDSWGAIVAAFKPQSGSAAPAPTGTSLAPANGSIGTAVTISGANFGATKGTSTVTFNGTTATPSSWSASSIVAPVPAGATTGSVVVTVGGLASNALAFTVTSTAPRLTSLSPTSGPEGTPVTINGANFGATKGSSQVTFNGTSASPTTWSTSRIVVPVPTGANTGNVVVTVGGVASNALAFTFRAQRPAPSLSFSRPKDAEFRRDRDRAVQHERKRPAT